MLAASTVAHLALLLFLVAFHWTSAAQRPLSAHEVTIVSLAPQTETRAAAAVRKPEVPDPVPAKESLRPSPVPAAARPVPPAQPPVPKTEVRRPENLVRDLMKNMTFPPEAPRLNEPLVAPQKSVRPVSPEKAKSAPVRPMTRTESVVGKLRLPEFAPTPTKPQASAPVEKAEKSRESVSSVLTKELQKPVSPPQPSPVEQPARVASKPAPDFKQPALQIHAPGNAAGLNPYLALIQHKISQNWVAPEVEVGGQVAPVVVKFRLERNGTVSEVGIERTSGNNYFDFAGRRAVLSAGKLPPFPGDITEPYLDVHVSFTVGEDAG
jgi:TonB family protein